MLDENKVEDILFAVDVKCKPRTMYRLGIKQVDRSRPLMVCLQTKEDKYEVLSKLWRLKYATNNINKGISITHDYTLEERKIIKEFVNEAKRKNIHEKEVDYVWKVRGSPKSNMRIVKLRI